MKVRATSKCYSGDKIRQEGEVFEIKSEDDLRKWMEPVGWKPKKAAKPKAEAKE